MQFQVSKKTLQQQDRPLVREKKLKNQDRILYVNGLFNPPPNVEQIEVGRDVRVMEQWRNVLSLGVLTVFLLLMLLVTIIGDYGFLASRDLEQRKMSLEQDLRNLKNQEILMREEIHGLKHDPRFIAAVVRRDLGWVKKNERVYLFNQDNR